MFRTWLRGSLSLFHLLVLTVLEAGDPIPMGNLADALDVSVASATGLVDRMEQRGLVEGRDDESDRRLLVQTTDRAAEDGAAHDDGDAPTTDEDLAR